MDIIFCVAAKFKCFGASPIFFEVNWFKRNLVLQSTPNLCPTHMILIHVNSMKPLFLVEVYVAQIEFYTQISSKQFILEVLCR
jgi:hypothetical protein